MYSPLRLFIFLLWLPCSLSAFANELAISNIEIEGNQRVSRSTIIDYLPIVSGQPFSELDSSAVIHALYETRFFKNISLYQRGADLVILVEESPTIDSVKITGNKKIDKTKLEMVFENQGFQKGSVFDRAVLEQIKRDIRSFYNQEGYFSIRVESTIDQLDFNRVKVSLEIHEGQPAKIRHLNLVGNHIYDQDTLLALFSSGTRGGLFSSADEYTRAKLQADLDILEEYYRSNGYLNTRIVSTQVSVSPDSENIYITVNIDEGQQYRLNSVQLLGGRSEDHAALQEQLDRLIVGDIVSIQQVSSVQDALENYYANASYAFAQVQFDFQFQDDQTVDVIYRADLGEPTLINRIYFVGNTRTRDYALRQEMRLSEDEPYSLDKLNQSRFRLQRLAYVSRVNIRTIPVVGDRTRVDIVVELEESVAQSSFTLGAGVSSNGISVDFGWSDLNWLGTGNKADFNLSSSQALQRLLIRYQQPFYTLDGVANNTYIDATRRDSGQISSTANYVTDTQSLGSVFSFPISEHSNVSFGAVAQHVNVFRTAGNSAEVLEFIQTHGTSLESVSLELGLSRDTRNRFVFPTSGNLNTLSVSWQLGDVGHYKTSYRQENFFQLSEHIVFGIRNRIDYGRGTGDLNALPFYARYFGGGVNSLRGYSQNTLGPVDENNLHIGGDLRFLGTLALILPPWESLKDSMRISLFTDYGNVYAQGSNISLQDLRATVGIALLWRTAVGPLTISYAEAYRKKSGDSLDRFQFSIGANF